MNKPGFLTFVASLLLSAHLIGCGVEGAPAEQAADLIAESSSAATEQTPAGFDSTQSLPADVDLSQFGERSTEKDSHGRCCHYSCTNGGRYYSDIPSYGYCVDWANFACHYLHNARYVNGSGYWNACR